MPIVPRSLTKPKLLIGEGIEEERFFKALLVRLGIYDVQVESYNGKDHLASYLKSLPKIPGFDALVSLGVTRDADLDAGGAFQRICSALQRSGLPVPRIPGEPASDDYRRINIFVLPDNASAGMLEDLCLAAVESDAAIECLNEYLACVLHNCNRGPENPAKARVHAWLASQPRADLRLGEAAEAGYWPWDSDAFKNLRRFITDL